MSAPRAEAWGIAPGYHDISGQWRQPPPATEGALLAAMGASAAEPEARDGALVVRAGDQREVPERELVTEDGALLRLEGRLPADLPLGYHLLRGELRQRR